MNKRIVFFNLGNFGSTGTIIRSIGSFSNDKGFEYCFFYPSSKYNKKALKNEYIICSRFFNWAAEKISFYTGLFCIWQKIHTALVIHKLKKISPSIVHLHNLHNTYINVPMLFNYLKNNNIKVVWTLHDCWSFTGRCPHFLLSGCDKWKNGCGHCPLQADFYPASLIDNTSKMWSMKKKWFTSLDSLMIVTPSKWLMKMVGQSFLKNFPVQVINNGIDLNIFRFVKSDFREKHKCKKYVVLGVSFGWSIKKGLDIFIKLSEVLPNTYSIVLVGTSDEIDKKLPSNIISIHITTNQNELAQIYSSANVFLNPTREETYPTVNMESLACGTPVVTFNTGGSPEMIEKDTGIVIDDNSWEKTRDAIVFCCEKKQFNRDIIIQKAQKFDKKQQLERYINLYKQITK